MIGEYSGNERRKYPRIDWSFAISYKAKGYYKGYDICQAKNISQGGILLCTNHAIAKDTEVDMLLRVPFLASRVKVAGKVLSSKEVTKGIVYDTRIQLIDADAKFFEELSKFIKEKHKGTGG